MLAGNCDDQSEDKNHQGNGDFVRDSARDRKRCEIILKEALKLKSEEYLGAEHLHPQFIQRDLQ